MLQVERTTGIAVHCKWVKQRKGQVNNFVDRTKHGNLDVLDRLFDTGDLVQVLIIGKYETGQLAGWTEGDWDDNGLFDTHDLVVALEAGTYEQDTRSAIAIGVPEPSTMLLSWTAISLLAASHRRRFPKIN